MFLAAISEPLREESKTIPDLVLTFSVSYHAPDPAPDDFHIW